MTLILDTTSRCDRCGAQAYVRFSMPGSGLTLDLCAHHHKAHELKLKALDVNVLADDRELLMAGKF